MKVDEVLERLWYSGETGDYTPKEARQQLKECVLGCLHKELIIPTKEWNEMTEAQMDYVNGRNAENREVRAAIEELFK